MKVDEVGQKKYLYGFSTVSFKTKFFVHYLFSSSKTVKFYR